MEISIKNYEVYNGVNLVRTCKFLYENFDFESIGSIYTNTKSISML